MSLDALTSLPDDARLWLIALEPAPDASAVERLSSAMDGFLAEWRHKGVQYAGAWAVLEGRVLALAEPTMTTAPSGCAIDGMMRKVNRTLEELSLTRVDPMTSVLVRTASGLRTIPKTEIEGRLKDGSLDATTPVLDLALFALGDLRSGKLEKPLAATWIGRKYKVAAAV